MGVEVGAEEVVELAALVVVAEVEIVDEGEDTAEVEEEEDEEAVEVAPIVTITVVSHRPNSDWLWGHVACQSEGEAALAALGTCVLGI